MRASLLFVIFLGVAGSAFGDCPRPTEGPNMVMVSDVSFPAPEGTAVSFRCVLGYRELGLRSVFCSGGQWSHIEMKCEKMSCGSAGEVVNGIINYSEGIDFGAVAHVVCNSGYRLVGNNQMNCGAHGWMEKLPECEAIMCDAPNPIANGYFSPMKDEYEMSEVVMYRCEGDYYLYGSKTASCSKDGLFKPEPPKCVLVKCPDPHVSNGEVVSGARPPYQYLSSVMFGCNSGYTMEGNNRVFCNIDSKWSPELPKCNPIGCKAPEIPNSEVVDGPRLTYNLAETATLRCSQGYEFSRQTTLKCGENNQWSAPLPECTRMTLEPGD